MLSTPMAKKPLAAGVALLFAVSSLAGGLASAAPLFGVSVEEPQQQPPKGPLGPSQAGPRKGEEPRATLGGTRGATHNETYQATGTIRSISDTALVLSTRSNGKLVRRSFTLTTATTQEGDLKAGARATVYYTVENSKRVATRVVVAAPRTSSPSNGKN